MQLRNKKLLWMLAAACALFLGGCAGERAPEDTPVSYTHLMLWDNKICIFYFLGFVLTAYLDLPLVALAVLGTIIAVAVGMNDYRFSQMVSIRAEVPSGGTDNAYVLDQEEEEFFR